jgi:hypothetical protein
MRGGDRRFQAHTVARRFPSDTCCERKAPKPASAVLGSRVSVNACFFALVRRPVVNPGCDVSEAAQIDDGAVDCEFIVAALAIPEAKRDPTRGYHSAQSPGGVS